ncbi:MAG: hypothetical protein AAB316_06635 [Bacteroidota bacterium]
MKFFEHRTLPLAPKPVFIHRTVRHFLISALLIFGSLALGMFGYHCFCKEMTWTDAFYNAAMILTGMGPPSPMTTDGAKIFASFYALFSGVAFLSAVSVLMIPWVHRFFHALHVDEDD